VTHTIRIDPVRLGWNVQPRDADVAFAIQVFRSRDQLRWCVESLRRHYPTARVVVISDGDGEDYSDIGTTYALDYIRGEHLMRLQSAHRYVTRLLQALVAGPEPYLFKIDPDTKVWRRLETCPAFTSVFGTLETVSEGMGREIRVPANVQGGCIGLTRDAAQALLDAGILSEQNCVLRHRETWARCDDMLKSASRGRICDDFILSWAAHQIGIPIVEAPEIRSRWRRTPDNSEGLYAVTHPHKLVAPAASTAVPSRAIRPRRGSRRSARAASKAVR